MTTMSAFAIGFAALLVAACGQGQAAAIDSARADSVARVRQDSIKRAQPGYIVDSILPVEELLRRFRVGLHQPTDGFEGGSQSRDKLVRAFVRSLEAADTAALIRLTITRSEFAYLVYPESPLSAPPYEQAPDLVWLRHAAASGTGLKRLLDRMAGSPLGFRSWSCNELPSDEGSNRIWKDCTIRFGSAGRSTQTMRLFASIIERKGRFKILSYANDF
jgi:hypothetical protein